jgi:protein-disulfide isomerase
MHGDRTRRAFLAAAGAATAGLAGCLGGGDGGGAPNADGGSGGTRGGSEGFGSHPATADLASQPYLGPPPGEATGTIVAFEDPSCTRCRTFEQQVFPKIASELTDPGKATFVFRGYPVVYPWGEPASKALEATYARSEDAFWALKEHYYDEQASFSTNTVLSATRSFLDDETDVDGAAVVDEAEDDGSDAVAAVGADLDAGEAAGTSVTPTLYLFRDGEYRTNAKGSVSYSVLTATLGV